MTNKYVPPIPFVTWDAEAEEHLNNAEKCITLMFNAYLECAEWADKPDEEDWSEACFSTATMDEAWFDCCAFLRLASWHISEWTMVQIGHDFWLTRNGHGTGFWDREFGSEEDREYLTGLAKTFGPASVYMGDDKCLHIA